MWGKRLAKLSTSQREAIFLRAKEGVSPTLLAKRFGTSVMTIYRIMGEREKKRTKELVTK